MEAFELRLWDGRLGRWLTVDPYGEFFSPYVGMGNNPINLIDPDGGQTDTDFKNKKTGDVIHFEDGINQVILVDDATFNALSGLSWKDSWDKNDTYLYDNAIKYGVKDPTSFYTINDVLKGQSLVPYANNCHTAANQQCINAGVRPGGPYDQVNTMVDNSLPNKGGFGNENLTTNTQAAKMMITNNLSNKKPVLTGVYYGGNNPGNRNEMTDHFVVIVGQGSDRNGNYYTYYDNYGKEGSNTVLNKLYVKKNGHITGIRKHFINDKEYQFYVTEVRINF
jgi:hypothetical protein